ncbi:hypothetical protein C6497_12965 [Candidatus Poribacteria bacterium]|nr:MAG: hypothetical protein C6497_12965 [Candidatus Poribacteria bacterium]
MNLLPLPILILLGFAVLGFCDYLKKLYTWHAKVKLFSNYRERLVVFHNNVIEGEDIDIELSDFLSENAIKIHLDSIVKITMSHPIQRVSTGIVHLINDIVTRNCYDFTATCKDFENMLTQNIGTFKNMFQQILFKTFNPIDLVKNGVTFILNIIPIINLIPTKIKGFLSTLFAAISIIETLLSLFSQKPLILTIIRYIAEWNS